jgi:acetyl esterase/lipase
VPTYFARHGVVGINLEFRLAPEFKYPACAEDVRLAVAWLRENVARFGGDPGRIFLMGQSAGAAHAAAYAYNKRLQPPGGPEIAGLIVASGRVRADNLPENPNARKVEAYYGTDPAVMEEGSAVNHVSAESVPTFIAIAEYENPLIDVYCAELFHKLAVAKRRAPPIMRLAGHNHLSLVTHFNTAEDALGRALLDFVRSPR